MIGIAQFLADGVSAFFIGHSLVSPTLPEMVDAVLPGRVEYQVINGAPLQVQWEDSSGAEGVIGRTWLPEHPVDALVLTERIPVAETAEWHDTNGYVRKWIDLAAQGNPKVKPYLYETWQAMPQGEGVSIEPWLQQIRDDLPVWQGIADEATRTNPEGVAPVQIIPAGQGMIRLQEAIEAGRVPGATSITDFFRDDIHPTDSGFYFVTMVHYAVLTGESPVGLSRVLMGKYGPYPAIPREQAPVLQEIAWETVQKFQAGERP
ncbi:hypothetical protein IQ24_01067 [Paracoccus sulfuroxidans]|uniref:Uncharacterized protein n=1 Tax=Paracoccus sulfuroxidans TaxID=384678 RepID=A0A562NU57_9RHOB|nr:hypothetical protein IQ24_01067 [Paracoccus sulfuroxidans]